ncbi:MAG: hypothetical protein ABIQ12_10550 [Opitutaceae bacterium]
MATFLAAHACLVGWDLAAAETAAPSGLEKLRKDLDAAKAPAAAARQFAPGISGAALPDWQGAEPLYTPTRRATGKNSGRETKSANWLLDAMKPPAASIDENQTLKGEVELTDATQRLSGKDSAPRPDADKSVTSTEPSDAKLRFGQNVAPNPLAQFLGGWMTPQDYALLKPVPAGESNLSAPNRGLDSLASGGTGRSSDLSTVIGMVGSASGPKSPAPPSSPHNNPYMQTLTVPAIAPIQPSIVPIPSSISPAPSALSSGSVKPSVKAAAPAKAPDLPSVSDDEKYFKQLKRF